MGLFDRFKKTSAKSQAAQEAKEAEEKLRKDEEDIMNSPWAQDVDKRFQELMSGSDFERKEGDGMVVYKKKSTEAGKEPSHQEPKESGGSSSGSGTAKTS